MESVVGAKGRLTLPKAVREHLGLEPGDRVRFFLHPDGTVVLLPRTPVTALKGVVKAGRRPVTVEEMDEAIAAGAAGAIPRKRPR